MIDYSLATFLSLTKDSIMVGYGRVNYLFELAKADFSKPIFYLQDFFGSSFQSFFQHAKFKIITKENQPQSNFELKSTPWSNNNEEIFRQGFTDFQALLEQQLLQKVVLYTIFEKKQLVDSRFINAIIQRLLTQPGGCGFAYGYVRENSGFMGITPEPLLELEDDGHRLKTAAIAGTRPKHLKAELMADDKELHEHQLVIDDVKRCLQKLGHCKCAATQIIDYQNISHLKTEIELHSRTEIPFLEAVQLLHPTPALGGYPKEMALDFLRKYNQKLDRQFFGAPIGIIYRPAKLARAVVAIRQMAWTDDTVKVAVGCGVVKGSNLAAEWQELKYKFDSVRKTLSI